MNRYTTKTGLLLALVACLFCLSACYKYDNVIPILPGPAPPQYLELLFDENTIDRQLYDSAVVSLQKQGSNTPYFYRFETIEGAPRVNFDGLRAGTYTAMIALYARTGNGQKREYAMVSEFEIHTDSTMASFRSPNGTLNDTWKARIILSYHNQIDFYISLDNTDPYFRIRTRDQAKWKSFSIKRFANNKIPGTGTELIAEADWTCDASCFVSANLLENSTAFAQFTNKVKAKTWNVGEIEIDGEMVTGEKIEDYVRYPR